MVEHACSSCSLWCSYHHPSSYYRKRSLWKSNWSYCSVVACIHACSRNALHMGSSGPRFIRYVVYCDWIHVLSPCCQVRRIRETCSNHFDSSSRHASRYECSCSATKVRYVKRRFGGCCLRSSQPWLERIRSWTCNSFPCICISSCIEHVPQKRFYNPQHALPNHAIDKSIDCSTILCTSTDEPCSRWHRIATIPLHSVLYNRHYVHYNWIQRQAMASRSGYTCNRRNDLLCYSVRLENHRCQ